MTTLHRHQSENDALDDEAFLSAIDSKLYAASINEGQSSTQNKTLHAINFEYDCSNDTDKPDITGDTYESTHVSALSDDIDIPDSQRQCPYLSTWRMAHYQMMTPPHAKQ